MFVTYIKSTRNYYLIKKQIIQCIHDIKITLLKLQNVISKVNSNGNPRIEII